MSTTRKRGAAGAVGLILGALAIAPAWAQAGDRQAALAKAQSLYEQATAEMDAGNHASACPKLEYATRLVPEALGGRLALAECYEGQGRLASAWSQYVLVAETATRVGQSDRAQRAELKAAELKPRLAELTVTVPPAARRIVGLSVTRDGIPLGKEQWGVPVPVDAGHHEVVVAAPGYQPWKADLEIKADGEHVPLEVQAPASETPEPPEPPEAPAPALRRATAAPPAPEPSEARPWQAPAGIATAGLGLAGLGVGAVLGGMALAKNSESNDGHCDAQDRCDPTGLDLRRQAVSLGNGSTIALVAGGVLAAGGLTLWMTAPAAKEDRVGSAGRRWSARLELLPGGAQVRWRW